MSTPIPSIGWPYLAAIAFTVLISGVMAYALESSHVIMAIYNGASAPAIVMFLIHVPGA